MRKVLFVPNEITESSINFSGIADSWEIDSVDDTRKIHRQVRDNHYRVGIAFVGENNNSLRRLRDTVLSDSAIEWLAVVHSRSLQNDAVCAFIADHCFDFHTLPLDLNRLGVTLGRAYGMSELTESLRRANDACARDHGLIGGCKAIRRLSQALTKIAGVDAPVLITGESGTGKELAAQTIHATSRRAGGPFVAVNCAAIPESLIQSELFGYDKGAFTGADKTKIGRIESAAGGTIFLDEIGDLSSDMQSTLLRFLQEKTIEHVGGTKSRIVDVRVIAATHVDLVKAVADGDFREDLYYRLNVLHIKTPPLRDCRGDVESLALHFFNQFANEKQARLQGFSQEALNFMLSYRWPGNVRELMNCVRRAMVMGEGRFIGVQDLGLERRERDRVSTTLEEVRTEADRHAIQCALEQSRNQISLAAETLGVSRITLYRLLEKYGIERKPATSHALQ